MDEKENVNSNFRNNSNMKNKRNIDEGYEASLLSEFSEIDKSVDLKELGLLQKSIFIYYSKKTRGNLQPCMIIDEKIVDFNFEKSLLENSSNSKPGFAKIKSTRTHTTQKTEQFQFTYFGQYGQKDVSHDTVSKKLLTYKDKSWKKNNTKTKEDVCEDSARNHNTDI